MNTITLGSIAAVAILLPAWGEVQAPSLERGAMIILDGGKLSFRKAREYRRVHKKDADAVQLKFIVREIQKIGKEEYYMDECGLREASYGGEGHVVYFGYAAGDGGRAYMAANVAVPENGKETMYFLRIRYNSDERIAYGSGEAASLTLREMDGNTYRGTVRASFFRSDDRDAAILFDGAPVTIIVPAEGESFPDSATTTASGGGRDDKKQAASAQPDKPQADAAASPADASPAASSSTPEPQGQEPTPDASAAPSSANPPAASETGTDQKGTSAAAGLPLPADKLEEAIRNRLKIMVCKPVDEELLKNFYAETVTRLTDGKKVPRQDIVKATRKLVSNWPRRGVSLIQAGTDAEHLELLIVFSFSDGKGEENACYGRISLTFDQQGKVNGMAESFTPDKQEFSPGITPFDYKGEKDVLIVE